MTKCDMGAMVKNFDCLTYTLFEWPLRTRRPLAVEKRGLSNGELGVNISSYASTNRAITDIH